MDRERDRRGHDLTRLRPLPVHLATLAAGFVVLLVLGRDQWFVYDDWAILTPSPDLLEAHQGHWNTAPTLLFQALRATVGLHSYLPYLALAVAAHLAVVHLLWRVMRRAGVGEWMATGFAAVLVVMGSAAENLLWAFQMGFMGAIALGLVVILLVDVVGPLRAPRIALIVAVSMLALTFSGTSLALLAGAGVLSIVRRGWWRSILLFVPAGIVYLTWFLSIGRTSTATLAPDGGSALVQVPLFFATMFGAGYGQFTGLVVLGPLVAIGLLIWLVGRVRARALLGAEAIASATLAASVVFALLTAVTRSGGELSAAGAQRYVYVIAALAVPTMALALQGVARRGRPALIAAIAAVAIVALANATFLVIRAGEQAAIEQRVQREVSAALSLVDDADLADGAHPLVPEAPDITMGDLRDAQAHDLVSPVPYSPTDLETVEASLTAHP